MSLNSLFKTIVRTNYEQQTSEYQKNSCLQLSNLKKLLNYLHRSHTSFPRGVLLDAGCGIPVCTLKYEKLFYKKVTSYVGLDISLNMLANSVRRKKCYFVNGDLETIPFKNNTFSIVLSNSVLHWLNIPEHNLNPLIACKEIYRVMCPDGVFVLSVSGKGTAKKFQDAYLDVIKDLPDAFFKNVATLRKDPIGSMDLSELVTILIESGFEIMHAQMDYEPVLYKTPYEYVNQVKAYGYEMYMSPFVDHQREKIWSAIIKKLTQAVGSNSYLHDQFMIYAIVKRM